MDAIKRCPFCGHIANIEVIEWEGHNEFFIKCPKCKIEQGHIYKTKRASVTAWNRRASNE